MTTSAPPCAQRGADRLRTVVAALAIGPGLAVLAACGGGSSGGSVAAPAGPVAATVAVVPAATTVTTGQALTVTVSISGAAALPAPDGTATLVSGGFSSGAVAVSGGKATLVVPAGVLAKQPGTATDQDTLTVAYTPSAAAAVAYLAGSGAATVTVSAAPAPTVTAAQTASRGHQRSSLRGASGRLERGGPRCRRTPLSRAASPACACSRRPPRARSPMSARKRRRIRTT